MAIVLVATAVLGVAGVIAFRAGMLTSARVSYNDTSVYYALRGIAGAQTQFRAAAVVDVDGDGSGEYGSFQELAGAATLRGRPTTE